MQEPKPPMLTASCVAAGNRSRPLVCWAERCCQGLIAAVRMLFNMLLHRDDYGHGTHTAATAAGNYGVSTPLSPASSVISGMAPRARLAVYKVRPGWGQSFALTALANDDVALESEARSVVLCKLSCYHQHCL